MKQQVVFFAKIEGPTESREFQKTTELKFSPFLDLKCLVAQGYELEVEDVYYDLQTEKLYITFHPIYILTAKDFQATINDLLKDGWEAT